MKAAFTLIPSESRRLIAKAVIQMKEVKIAKKKAYIILGGGTTNGNKQPSSLTPRPALAQTQSVCQTQRFPWHGLNRLAWEE